MRQTLILTFLITVLLAGCKQIQKATDVITNPSAREVYARDFSEESLVFTRWETAFEKAKNDSISVALPYTEQGKYQSPFLSAYSYNVQLQEGERLLVRVEKPIDSVEVFIDVFKKKDTLFEEKPTVSSKEMEAFVLMEVTETSEYKVIIQPEIEANIPFNTYIYTQPTYLFPVAGKGNKSIQSFWGASRDGGRRSHEGVDIFAKRGTPVVAAVDGIVRSTGNRGLGGKQVWLRDGIFGGSLYYAHLDSIAAHTGQRVKKGDTLGFVGNTGNARTTAPHLHFGIYKGYSGAIDPLPFIKMTEVPKIESSFENFEASVSRNKAELRLGPSTKYTQISALQKDDAVAVLGKAGNWYHIQVTDSLKGFMHRSLLNIQP